MCQGPYECCDFARQSFIIASSSVHPILDIYKHPWSGNHGFWWRIFHKRLKGDYNWWIFAITNHHNNNGQSLSSLTVPFCGSSLDLVNPPYPTPQTVQIHWYTLVTLLHHSPHDYSQGWIISNISYKPKSISISLYICLINSIYLSMSISHDVVYPNSCTQQFQCSCPCYLFSHY